MDPTTLLLPGADFVRDIDVLLDKGHPDTALPWAGDLSAPWGRSPGFKHVVDVGAGLGAFTGAIIQQLGRWQLTAKLESLTLIDGDPDLFRPTVDEGTQEVCHRLGRLLAQARPVGSRTVEPRYVVENASVVPEGIQPLVRLGLKPDLIIASHVTYYLGDGSGLDFVRGLLTHLAPGGLLWLVIRRLDCPIYQERQATLTRLHKPDPKPRDFAELFLSERAQHIPASKVVRNVTYRYPMPSNMEDRLTAIHLLMWRAYADAEFPAGREAAKRVSELTSHPFHEEHIVLSN